MTFGLTDNKFWVEFTSCRYEPSDLKTESELYARELSEKYNNLVLSLSTGLDSQVVLHSFLNQGLELKCAFMSLVGYNQRELEQLKILESKYGFKADVVEIDPIALKSEIIEEAEAHDLRPYQIIHKKFLSMLSPTDTFIQGLEGPDLVFKDGKTFLAEGWNNFEKSRLRAFKLLERPGEIISWERKSEIFTSVMTDAVMTAFLNSKEYFLNNHMVYNGPGTRTVEWDTYIKPILYGRHWKDELCYFPKYGGPEGIDYIIQGPQNKFRENVVYISIERLLHHLTSNHGVKRFVEK